MNNEDYISRLQLTIRPLHSCGAVHRGTVPVHEMFPGKTVWKADVEVFDLTGHPKAKRAYAWGYADDKASHYTAVLEIPPVDSAETAVKAAIMAKK